MEGRLLVDGPCRRPQVAILCANWAEDFSGMFFKNLRSSISGQLSAMSAPFRLVVLAAACIVVAVVLFWLLNQTIYYLTAKSYVDELADAYNLNRGFTSALVWASFAAIVPLSGWAFSFSKLKRQVGFGGLIALLIAHSIAIGMADRNFQSSGKAEKCFVMTRDSVKIMNRIGADSETGRECRPLTPVMAEKIELYRAGKRPVRIVSGSPAFFSALSGEPIVWYAKTNSGEIELFDLMGYHPQTGQELAAVDPQIAAQWQTQTDKAIKRVPVRIDPETGGFFDPISGAPKVWYWKSDASEYEFYDGPGFHPRTGEPLQVVTRSVIAEWKKAVEELAAKKKAEQERLEREARERQLREQQERQQRAEAEQRAREAEKAAEAARARVGNECDRLAANPTDVRRTSEGATFEVLKGQAEQALEACTRAVEHFPNELRYQYQLGRAMQFKDRKRAFEIFTALTQARYPAAFDNLGGMMMYDRKDIPGAIRIFTIGASLDDADSMTSLADLVDRGYYGQQNPYQVKWSLLNKAAQLNHAGAIRAVAAEKTKADAAQVDQENARRALEIFGGIVRGVAR